MSDIPLPPIERFTLKRAVNQAVGLAVLMIASLGGYLAILKWRGWDGYDHITWIPWDEVVPFQPGWVWAYLIPYIVGPTLVGLMSRETFAWFVPRAIVAVLLSLTVFIIYPTQTAARPPLTLEPGPTRELYKWMIEVDEPPANAAPSLHVSLTCLLALALLRDFRRWWLPIVAGTLVVWAATLFTRQHHLIDVGSGALVACAVVLVWPRRQNLGENGALRAGADKSAL
ncbi:MAG TPA: phosphatase PAP2 family protein [Gemmataceae bacterium]|nr:phosphatase PAP2 family protein [Gemmataceae bacterium]